MTKQQLLDDLRAKIQINGVCSELADQATQLVMGSGNPDANIVLIGEAPGKKEDQLGVPFVGAAGKFLDQMFEAAGLERSDVYITNIVKYRPPDNRDPLPEEKAAFWPYLMQQLEIISPKVILTLGRHSGSMFIPDLRISDDHGRVFTIDLNDRQYTLVPLYHPAAALYNGKMRQVLIDDFLNLMSVVG